MHIVFGLPGDSKAQKVIPHPSEVRFRKPWGCLKYRLRFRKDDFARCYIKYKAHIEERYLMYDDAAGKKYEHPCYQAGDIVAINAGDGPKKPPTTERTTFSNRKIGIHCDVASVKDAYRHMHLANSHQSGKTWAQMERDQYEQAKKDNRVTYPSSQTPDQSNHKVLCYQYPCKAIDREYGCCNCSGYTCVNPDFLNP